MKPVKSEIVKIQINALDPLNHQGLKLLQVSNEDESLHWEGSPAGEMQKLLGDRTRAYFYARVVNRKLFVGQEAPAQKW